MKRGYPAGGILALCVASVALGPLPVCAQGEFQYENELVAKRHLFPDVGVGVREVHRGPDGNYYVLTAPAPALQIYTPGGKRSGQFPSEPAAAAKGAALVYAESFDIDRAGRVVICDRGAHAVKLYSPAGSVLATIPADEPLSVVFLPAGEFAVASGTGDHLITTYDLTGKEIRQYGDPEQISDRADLNAQANFGHLAADDAGDTYFSFDYFPEPTVRKFDRAGYLASELSLKTLEFQPAAQAARKAMARSDADVAGLHRIIGATGLDPQTQDLWVAIGTLLMHFDKDGRRLASFRTYLSDGGRIEATQILVESDRLILVQDPLGVFSFEKPDKVPPSAP